MGQYISATVLALGFLSAPAFATFLPPNDLAKEDGLLRGSQVTEADFNDVIDAAEAYYRPLISTLYRSNLVVKRLWDKSTVNAMAMRAGSEWKVEMYGGLARRPEITKDGFALVLCHEIGHHLAGYPFVPGGGISLFGMSRDWAANEGQSDYFASQACARQLWRNDLALNASYAESISQIPRAACDQVWDSTADRNLCYRIMTAAESLGAMASSSERNPAKWSTPSQRVVRKTENGHPDAQCRLDTYGAGALCDRDFNANEIPGIELDKKSRNGAAAEKEASRTSCMRAENYELGWRPTCWFKPLIDG